MTDRVALRSRLAGRRLPEALRAELVGGPPDVDESLLELLQDDSLLSGDADGGGFVPLHAMHLLAARGTRAPIQIEAARSGSAPLERYVRERPQPR